MAKEIICDQPEPPTAERDSEVSPFQAVVFEEVPSTQDFSCSREVALPGMHSAAAAWSAVRQALKGPGGRRYIGGTIRPART